MGRGRLFVISGPSGVGKGTLAKRLIRDMDIVFSVSMTTRTPRVGEIDGTSYHFVDRQEFQKRIDQNGFLEYAEVYGNYYGTPLKETLDVINSGQDLLLDIDIQGALQVKKNYPDGVFIFILPPSMAELRKRITGRRTETPESLERRMGATLHEVSYVEKYDYCVINGEIDEALNRLKAILIAEHSRVSADIRDLIEKYKEEK